MSSAGRSARSGTGHERHADDSYRTEERVVDALVDWMLDVWPAFAAYPTCDAGAGDGSIGGQLIKRGFVDVFGVEKRVDLANKALEVMPTHCEDFLVQARGEGLQVLPPTSLVVMNPPYSLAMEFVQAALELVEQARARDHFPTVAALLRLNWLGSNARAQFHREHPAAIGVLPQRPSFTPDGRTDSTEYAWFIWSGHPELSGGTWRMLSLAPRPPKTPKAREPLPDIDIMQGEGDDNDL